MSGCYWLKGVYLGSLMDFRSVRMTMVFGCVTITSSFGCLVCFVLEASLEDIVKSIGFVCVINW